MRETEERTGRRGGLLARHLLLNRVLLKVSRREGDERGRGAGMGKVENPGWHREAGLGWKGCEGLVTSEAACIHFLSFLLPLEAL